MRIETKYNIGDTVYTLSNNKICVGKIVKSHFQNDYSSSKNEYDLEKMLGWTLDIKEYSFASKPFEITRLETELFLSKEDLLEDFARKEVSTGAKEIEITNPRSVTYPSL